MKAFGSFKIDVPQYKIKLYQTVGKFFKKFSAELV